MLCRPSISVFLVLVAAASARGLEPTAAPRTFQPSGRVDALSSAGTARPLNVTRPIFVVPAPTASTGNARSPAGAPLHRKPMVFTPTKPVPSPASADAINPAPPPQYGTSNVPFHRRTLGW